MAGLGKAHLREGDVRVRVEDLVVEFRTGKHETVHAVSGISLDIRDGETLCLVGESGCGKSTTGRAILQLPPPTSGSITFDGVELTELKGEKLRRMRPKLQMIFQDPISSLNDRRTVRDLVSSGLEVWGWPKNEIGARVDEYLEAVGLDPAVVGDRYPRSFSGGQCQRICIARALMLDPTLVICDEPVSALDVSVQAQILNLLADLKERYGITLLFITHDLGVVKNVSDRIIVMYLGRICEVAAAEDLFAAPAHPYTRLLLESVPRIETTGKIIREPAPAGELPSPVAPPSGCRFHTRCPIAEDVCREVVPELRPTGSDHFVACHFPLTSVVDPPASSSSSSSSPSPSAVDAPLAGS